MRLHQALKEDLLVMKCTHSHVRGRTRRSLLLRLRGLCGYPRRRENYGRLRSPQLLLHGNDHAFKRAELLQGCDASSMEFA
jgi:hypothetical protein